MTSCDFQTTNKVKYESDFDFVYRAYSERLTKEERHEIKHQFNAMDADHDGFLGNSDLVQMLSIDSNVASKLIVHLNKGRKDAKQVSFDRFLESRIKHDLSLNAQSIYHEILRGGTDTNADGKSLRGLRPVASLVGFDSCESASNGSSTPGPPSVDALSVSLNASNVPHCVPPVVPQQNLSESSQSTTECLSESAVIEFAVTQFPFKMDVCDLSKVFQRFGGSKGVLSSEEFINSMKVRRIGDALGMECSHRSLLSKWK